jgi:2-keto-4-pentenoate hydratase/2-oxohepta-3-ene-1,7-dioic acid hydratase in catechol pathway
MRIGNLSGRLTVFTDVGAVDVEKVGSGQFGSDPQAVYERWDEFVGWAAQAISTDHAVPFEMNALGPPCPRPAQVFGIGANYEAHTAEAKLKVPEFPVVFTKFPTSITGPIGDIVLSGPTVDWEAELVAVISKRARNVPIEQAWDYVAGLTVGQDLSDRTEQMKNERPQWSLGKSFPGFGPTGPWLVTVDEFPNPDDLELGCTVNGKEMQKARTSSLVFSVPALIAELSAKLPLLPGDIIFTGTPAGVGAARRPPVYLDVADELVTTVEGIGELRQRFVSA